MNNSWRSVCTRTLIVAAAASGLCGSALGCGGAANTGGETQPVVLPLKTLRLYETGVGYFEREGRLDADSTMSLPVPGSQLDDALKTLIVVTREGRASVGGVEFQSRITPGLARKLAGLPSLTDEPITYHALLASLAGAHVIVRVRRVQSDTSVTGVVSHETEIEQWTGRLIDVVDEVKPAPPAAEGETQAPPDKTLMLMLLTDDGELRQVRAADVESVKPTDEALQARIEAALDALSSRSTQQLRQLRILASSSGPVTIGYVAETPIWRSSYRLMLQPKGESATLQGWALIHNDSDEHWRGITVELVNGRPDSFLLPLAAPRYGRRPLAEPAEELSTAAQLLDHTADEMWGDHFDADGSGSGEGFGSGYGRLGRSHRARPPRVRMGATRAGNEESTALAIGNLADIAPAEGVESGALFSYRLGGGGVDLRPHGSALLPFLSEAVDVRRLTLFDSLGEAGRAAVRMQNNTKQTLPAGPVTVFEQGGFAGETGIPRLKPGQRAFAAFATDLDIEVDLVNRETTDDVSHISTQDDQLQVDYARTTRAKLELSNRSASSRLVYIRLDLVNNARIEGADELDYDKGSDRALAIFKLKPGEKFERELVMVEGLVRKNSLGDLDKERIEELLALPKLSTLDRTQLTEAAKLAPDRKVERELGEELTRRRERAESDIQRLRESLKSLGAGAATGDAATQLVQRMVKAEDELSRVLDDEEKRRKASATRLDALTKVLAKLTPPPKRKP